VNLRFARTRSDKPSHFGQIRILLASATALSIGAFGLGVIAGAPAGASESPQAGLAKAEAVVKQYEKPATNIGNGLLTPLKSAPAKGKTLVFVTCSQPQCTDAEHGAAAAASALGWHIVSIPFDIANTAAQQSALLSALQHHPVAVLTTSDPVALLGSVLPAYKSAGVGLIDSVIGPGSLSAPMVNASGDNDPTYNIPGKIAADYFIADSKGKGNVLLVNQPQLTILSQMVNAAQKEIKQNCPGCQSSVVNTTLAQLDAGTTVPAVVAALQKDPNAKYVIDGDGVFLTGLPAALQAAGITGVKEISNNGGVQDSQNVASGTEAADMVFPGIILGWSLVDSAARYSEHTKIIPGDGGLPVQLFVKSNVGTPQANYNEPNNYAALYKKLWHVNS
jgi:ribose transport system substrate-binding protein